jgi:hypothetical protein
VRDQLGFDVERAISEWERNLEELGIGPVSLTYEEGRRTIRFMHSWRDLTDKLPAARRRRRCRPCRRQSRWSAAGCVVDVARATFQDQPQRPLQLISETEDRQE